MPPFEIGWKLWETGLEAEQVLSEDVSMFSKLLFLATNLPYWMLFYVSFKETLLSALHLGESSREMCGRPEFYAMLSFLVAASSTIMHASQLRMGNGLCCAHPQRTECFHERGNLKRFKKVDISCAFLALMACVYCHAWNDIVYTFSLALPLFVSGLIFKRLNYNYMYMIVHGAWHVVTSALVWDAVMVWHK